jgi:hypothetical protein
MEFGTAERKTRCPSLLKERKVDAQFAGQPRPSLRGARLPRGLSMIRALPHGRDHPTVCLSSHGATHLKLGMGYPTSTELACVKKRVQRIDGVCPLFTETPFVLLKRI